MLFSSTSTGSSTTVRYDGHASSSHHSKVKLGGQGHRNGSAATKVPNPSSTPIMTTRERAEQPAQVPSQGLRAQLHQLMPKHALFNVHLHIQEIASVPLVRGEFGVRWKFKNVQSDSKSSLLRGLRKISASKGKETEQSMDNDVEDYVRDDSLSIHSADIDSSLPSVIVSNHTPSIGSSSGASNRSVSSQSIAATSSLSHNSNPTTSSSSSSDKRIPGRSNTSYSSSGMPQSDFSEQTASSTSHSVARGMTDFAPLQEHSVFWDHAVDVVVKMDVNRDTSDLLPNELKLVVMQRVVPGDPDAPHNPRLGCLYLNLAEYADPSLGPVTRRYLLHESKTNAVLKLTILVTQLESDNATFRAPPLPKGEILTGVTQFLEEAEAVYKTRPVTLTRLFEGIQERNLQEQQMHERPTFFRAGSSQVSPSGLGLTSPTKTKFFYDINKLPCAYGPQSTQDIIEALFNPVPTSSTNDVSPFTYYVEPTQLRKARMEWQEKNDNWTQPPPTHAADVHPGATLMSHVDDNDTPINTVTAKGKWWSRTPRSRPSTPVR